MITLTATDADNPGLGNTLIPIRRHGVKNQAKVSCLTRLNGGSRNRLSIHVRFAGANQAEWDRQPLGELTHVIVEADLNGDSGHGPVAAVGDLAVDIGDLGAGKASGLAHLDAAEAQLGGVRVGGRHAGADGSVRRAAATGYYEDPKSHDDYRRGDDPRHPRGSFPGLV